MQHQPVRIRLLKIFYSDVVLGIQVTYFSQRSLKKIKCAKHRYSKMFGTSVLKMTLHEDEYIISVEGNFTDKSIHRIVFRTNKDQIVSITIHFSSKWVLVQVLLSSLSFHKDIKLDPSVEALAKPYSTYNCRFMRSPKNLN